MSEKREIKLDAKNYRKHSDKNKRIIKKSLEELGAGRSILIDSENEIIAGNGVFEQWGSRPVKIVESDGKELIVVKRTDLKPSDENRKTLALVDNHANDLSEFDNDLILEDFDKNLLEDWEFESELNTQIKDIEEIESFNESVNFIIKCDSIEELEKLQTKLNTSALNISYKDFLIKTRL